MRPKGSEIICVLPWQFLGQESVLASYSYRWPSFFISATWISHIIERREWFTSKGAGWKEGGKEGGETERKLMNKCSKYDRLNVTFPVSSFAITW